MAITEDILVRLRVQGQQQFASAMGGAATQTTGLGTAAGTAGKQVDATGKKAKGAAGRMQSFAGGVAKVAAATGGIYAAQKVLTDSVRNAVDLGEQINKTAVVFRGPGAKAVQDWSKTTATGIGISQRAALEAAGVFGNMLVPMGLGRTEAAKMSKGMVDLAGDMASFNNATPEETLDALRAGIAGETEPLRRFGVRLSQARLEQQAMSMGLKKGKAPLTDHARALATQALILKDTKDAQGDFARTSDSLANKQRTLSAQYENFTAALGQKLTPIIAFLVDNLDALAIGIGVGLVAAFAAWTYATIAQVAATTGLAAALQATGIPLIIIAIAALVAGLIIAYKKCETFRNVVNAVWGALKKAWVVAVKVAAVVGRVLVAAFKVAWAIISKHPLILIIRNLGKIVAFVRSMPGKISSAASGMWDGMKNAFKSVLNTIIGWWNGLEFKVPGIDKGPIHIGGFTLGLPDIPTLATGGPATAGRAAPCRRARPRDFRAGHERNRGAERRRDSHSRLPQRARDSDGGR